jgi:electron transfer flavoprotein alpha subunit
MNVLVFAEQRDSHFKKAAFEAVSVAHTLAGELGGTCTALVIGDHAADQAGELGAHGAATVLAAVSPRFARHAPSAWAAVIARAATSVDAQIVVLSASQMGKDLGPRVAVLLEAGLAADCIALRAENGDVVATRPVFAGKATTDVRILTPTKIFTVRPNVFPVTAGGATAPVQPFEASLEEAAFQAVVTGTKVSTGRPDVAEADVIVSGGRGMKGPEHFHLIEELADVLHAGVGASRAVVDAGWRPHDEQVGQTGKTVSPSLYIACGISGAVQHLAGMSSSKYIVAINKDKDAPIFQIADYGIVGDVFDVLPEFTARLKETLGH